MSIWIYDIECYPNLFLFCAQNYDTQEKIIFTDTQLQEIKDFINTNITLVGYNNIDYDNTLLAAILNNTNLSTTELKKISDSIIKNDLTPDLKQLQPTKRKLIDCKSIDISYYFHRPRDKSLPTTQPKKEREVEKFKYFRNFISLKELAARFNLQTIIDLPYDPAKSLTDTQKQNIIDYCWNDIDITTKAYQLSLPEIELRKVLEKDCSYRLINRSGPSVAEKYLLDKYCQAENIRPKDILYLNKDIIYEPFTISVTEKLNIEYKTPRFQAWYNRIKKITIPIANNRPVLSVLTEEFTVKGLDIKLGAGGIHACKPGIYESTKDTLIIDIDVTSYYLAIIINLGLYPNHLTQAWTEEIRKLRDNRVKAKREKRTIEANALKIIALSAWGKFGNPYSWMYSPELTPAITIPGQAYLLLLIEKLQEKKITVFYANTDGLTIQIHKEQIEEFRSICKEWENQTGFNLEETRYKKVCAKDANNYIASKTDGSPPKTKGKQFLDELSGLDQARKVGDYPIVAQAVNQYFLNNIEPEQTITQCHDITKFRMIYRASRGYTAYYNNIQQQKTIRYYAAINGGTLEKRKEEKIIQLEAGNSARLMLTLPTECPKDIDYQFYISKAKTTIEAVKATIYKEKQELPKCITSSLNSKIQTKHKKQQQALTKIIGEGQYCLFAGHFNSDNYPVAPDSLKLYGKPWLWLNGLSARYYSQQQFKDYPYPLDFSKISYIVLNPFVVDSHEKTLVNVAQRRAISIEYDNISLADQYSKLKKVPHTVLCWSGNKSIHSHIIFTRALESQESEEIDSLMAQIFGDSDKAVWQPHQFIRLPGGYNYAHNQEQVIIGPVRDQIEPEKFLDWLRQQPRIYPEATKPQQLEIIENPEKYLQTEKLLDSVLLRRNFKKQKSLGWGNIRIAGVKYISHCPNAINHSSGKSNNTEFAIFLGIDGKIKTKCQHSSCTQLTTKDFFASLKIDLAILLESVEKIEPPAECYWPEKIEIPRPSQDLVQAFSGWEDCKLIIAEPGSGKTTQALLKEYDAICKMQNYTYIANNTKDLDKSMTQLALLSEKTLTDLKKHILVLKSGRKNIEDELVIMDSSSTETKNYRIIQTHKTYTTRKGVGKCFYSFVNWILENKPFLVMDEINEFIESLETSIALELASTNYKPRGASEEKTRVYRECPGFSTKSFRCAKCKPCRNIKFDVDHYGNAVMTLESDITKHIRDIKVEFSIYKTISLPEVNFDVHFIRQHKTYLERKKDYPVRFEDNEVFDSITDIKDAIECSYEPCIIDTYATAPKLKRNGDFELDEHKKKIYIRIQNPLSINDKQKAFVKYPSRACGKYLILRDLAVLQAIAKNTQGVRLLCTDVNPKSNQMLQTVFNGRGLEIVHCERKAQKIESVAIIGYQKECSIKNLTQSLQDIRVLEFEPNDRKAKTRYNAIPSDYPAALFHSSDLHFTGKFVETGYTHIIANSFGTLGKAINLTQFPVCVINATVYKPYIACASYYTKDQILAEIERYRFELIIQNFGRILRGSGKKLVIIYNISKTDFAKLVEKANLSKITDKHYSKYIESDEKLIYKLTQEYIATGDFKDLSEKDLPIKSQKISKKQRIAQKQAVTQEKRRIQHENTQAKIAEIKNFITKNSVSWRTVTRKFHIDRLNRLQIKELKAYHRKAR